MISVHPRVGGETSIASDAGNRAIAPVHPRVGGETWPVTLAVATVTLSWGPSPRGRGNQAIENWADNRTCPVPAWAKGVHPRVGGETPRGRGSSAPF